MLQKLAPTGTTFLQYLQRGIVFFLFVYETISKQGFAAFLALFAFVSRFILSSLHLSLQYNLHFLLEQNSLPQNLQIFLFC